MGLLNRARSLAGESSVSSVDPIPSRPRGLLRRSLALLNRVLPHKPAPAPPLTAQSDDGQQLTISERRERTLAQMGEIETGIDAPGRLFSVMKRNLNLQRAALLLYDPIRMVFSPWALAGFDETTKHRLRIPLGANETLNRLASGKVYLLEDAEQLQSFEQFFSFREFSTLSNLLLAPFIHESKFMGLLLSAGSVDEDRDEELSFYKTFSERAAAVLYRTRERHLESAKRKLPQRPESLRESVRAALVPLLEQGRSPIMIRIDMTNLMASVNQRNPFVDSYRLFQDISRILLSQFQSLGTVFQIDRERLLLLITGGPKAEREGSNQLLLFHLKNSLSRLLPELIDGDRLDLDEQVRIPGSDIEEALTHLAEIV